MAEQIVRHKLTSPEIQALYSGWLAAGRAGRQRILEAPREFLRTQAKLEELRTPRCPSQRLLHRVQRLTRQAEHLRHQLSRHLPEFSTAQLGELRQTLEQEPRHWDHLLEQITSAHSPEAPLELEGLQTEDLASAGSSSPCQPQPSKETMNAETKPDLTHPPSAQELQRYPE